MSAKEVDRAELLRRVRAKELKQAKAAALMGLSVRQVNRAALDRLDLHHPPGSALPWARPS